MSKDKKNIVITITATPGSGKSRILFLLKTYLRLIGFNVEHINSNTDFKDEQDFDKFMSQSQTREILVDLINRADIQIKEIIAIRGSHENNR